MLGPLRQRLGTISMMGWFAPVILALLVAYAISEVRFIRQEMLARTLLPKADRMERILTNIVDNATYQVGYIAKQIGHNGVDKEHIRTFLQTFNDGVEQSKLEWGRFLWADANAQIVFSNTEIYKEPKDVSERTYMAMVRKFPFKLYMDEARIGIDNNEPIIPLAMGVTDQRGQFLGAVLGCILLHEVEQRFNETIKDKPLGYILYDHEMRQVLAHVDSKFFTPEKLIEIREWALREQENRQQNKMEVTPWRHHHALYHRMPKYLFSLVLIIPT
jgi:hypothetical protein